MSLTTIAIGLAVWTAGSFLLGMFIGACIHFGGSTKASPSERASERASARAGARLAELERAARKEGK